MKIKKPQFWKKKNNILSLLFLPLSILIQFFIKIKIRLTTKNSLKFQLYVLGTYILVEPEKHLKYHVS